MLGSLKLRIPVLIVGMAVASAVAVGAVGWMGAKQGLATAAVDRLSLSAADRAVLVETKASAVGVDLAHLAGTALIGSSLPDLAQNINPTIADFPKTMAYFRDGAPEKRIDKDGADAGTQYGMRHSKIHALVKEARAAGGYADVLLLGPDGRVVYSALKGDDFGAAVTDPAVKGTGLAALFDRLKTSGKMEFQDYAPYAPGGARPSAFVGKAIERRSNAAMNAAQEVLRVGYVVLRMDPDIFNAVLKSTDNLGADAQTFAAGPDGLLRSDLADASDLAEGSAMAGKPVTGIGLSAVPSEGVAGQTRFSLAGVEHIALSGSASVFGTPWMVVAIQSTSEALRAVDETTRTMGITLAAVLAATLVIGMVSARGITAPLGRLTAALRGIAAGDADTEIAGARRRDEIGEIARAVVQIREMTEAEAVARVERDEQQRRSRDDDRRRMTETLARDFEERVGSVVAAVAVAAENLERSADEMARLAVEANERSGAVAYASEQASGNVRSVAAATEEMFSSIRTVATMIGRSGEIAAEADRHAASTNQIVSSLSETASRIGSVVDIIQSIAEQTNLLALNATIEAARAGEAGRGFAVVAGEVKNLAGQTAKATEEIGAQIAAMRAATGTAVGAIGEIRQVVSEIGNAVGAVVAAVEEQSSATNEIARSAQGASDGTSAVSTNIADVRHAVGRTDEAAATVATQARELGREAAELKDNLARFVRQILAA